MEFTKSEQQYIRRNLAKKTYDDIAWHLGCKVSAIRKYMRHNGLKKTRTTAWKKEFVKEHYKDMTLKEMGNAIGMDPSSIRHIMTALGLSGCKRGYHENFTGQQKQWMVDNCKRYKSCYYLAKGLNEMFGTNFTTTQVECWTRKNKIHDYKSIPFKEKEVVYNLRKPIGSEIRKHDRVMVRVSTFSSKGRKSRDEIAETYVYKDEMILKEHGMEVIDGGTVIYLDGNKNNFSIENMVSVTLRAQRMFTARGWHKLPTIELRRTALAECMLEAEVRNIKENTNEQME